MANGWRLEHGRGWVRDDPDGTVWLIALDITRGGATLTMTYREHQLKSHHPDVDAAQRHHRDMQAMWSARSLREYTTGRC